MGFEFDEHKSRANLAKHGIDFVQAQELWNDENLVEVPARNAVEPRLLLIGRIAEKCYTEIITYRGENVRIISVRCARQKEEDYYESQ